MKRNLNPHEARAVVAILEDPRYDEDFDPYTMASDIVRAINARRESEKLWVVAAQVPGRAPTMLGPFTTQAAALGAVELARVGYGNTEVNVGVWRIMAPGQEEDVEDPLAG